MNSLLIGGLAAMTFIVVIFFLVVERIEVAKAQKEHTHSAITEHAPEQRDG